MPTTPNPMPPALSRASNLIVLQDRMKTYAAAIIAGGMNGPEDLSAPYEDEDYRPTEPGEAHTHIRATNGFVFTNGRPLATGEQGLRVRTTAEERWARRVMQLACALATAERRVAKRAVYPQQGAAE